MRQNSDEVSLDIDGIPIKRAETSKYRGVVLDSTLSFHEHVRCMKRKSFIL